MPLLVGAITDLLFQFLLLALLSMGFAVFYAVLPNTKVEWRAALVGGVVGGGLWQSQQGEVAYLPARPLQQITCHDVLQALRTAKNGGVATREDAMRERERGHYEGFQSAEKATAPTITLATLAAEAAIPGQSSV